MKTATDVTEWNDYRLKAFSEHGYTHVTMYHPIHGITLPLSIDDANIFLPRHGINILPFQGLISIEDSRTFGKHASNISDFIVASNDIGLNPLEVRICTDLELREIRAHMAAIAIYKMKAHVQISLQEVLDTLVDALINPEPFRLHCEAYAYFITRCEWGGNN